MKQYKFAPFQSLETQLRRHGILKKTVARWMGQDPAGLSLILRGHRRPNPTQAYNLIRLTKRLEALPITASGKLPIYESVPKRKSQTSISKEAPHV